MMTDHLPDLVVEQFEMAYELARIQADERAVASEHRETIRRLVGLAWRRIFRASAPRIVETEP